MSTLKVDTITNDTEAVDFTYNAKVGNGTLKKEYYEQGTEPAYPCDGALWFNTSDDTFHIYANGGWYATTATAPVAGMIGDRGLFGGGHTGGSGTDTNVISYISIPTPGNATDFGDLTVARIRLGSCSSGSRGIWAGGETVAYGGHSNVIDYVTIANTGNATDFGNLSANRWRLSCASNTVRGLIIGGKESGKVDTIEYITIATTGNATDF